MNDPSKKYKLTFEPRSGYLYAFIKSDTMDTKMAAAYLGEIAEMCHEMRADRLLIERDVPVMLPDSDLFFTTNDFANVMKGIKVAFFNPYTAIADNMTFAVLIGNNRGASFTVHNTITDAENWLLDGAIPAEARTK